MGSDEYVRTYRMIIRRILGAVSSAVSANTAYQRLDEAEGYETVEAKLQKKGIGKADLAHDCAVLKDSARMICSSLGPGRSEVGVGTPQSPPGTAVGGW